MSAGPAGDRPHMDRTPPYGVTSALGRVLGAFVALGLVAGPAGAQSPLDRWLCLPLAELDLLAFTTDTHVLNNFRLRESTDFFSGRPIVEVSFSAVNRSAESLHLSMQFLVMGPEPSFPPVFAVSAKPDFGSVRANETAQVKASVMVEPGELSEAHVLCVRGTT